MGAFGKEYHLRMLASQSVFYQVFNAVSEND